MPKWHWLMVVRSMMLALRIIIFEQYSNVMMALWWCGVLFWTAVMFMLHWGVALGVLAVGIVLYRYYADIVRPWRRKLIRKGDCVEFAKPTTAQRALFEQAIILYGLRPSEAAKTSLFDKEQIEYYDFFYLVRGKKKNILIPYEWIIGIEIDDNIEIVSG